MTKYNEKYRIESARIKGYDYSRTGAYFITICTSNREPIFGEISNNEVITNQFGAIVRHFWLEIPKHYPNVALDEFIIMPDHLHGILTITESDQNILPKEHQFQKIIPKSVGSIIRGFKIGVTKWFRQNTDIYTVWQRNYHEHIIRDDESLSKIREYIRNNPMNDFDFKM